MNILHKSRPLLAGLLSISLLAGCGTDSSQSESEAKDKESTSRIMTDANGDVTIPTKLKRILAPNAEDSLVALGETPVAQWAIGTDVKDYLQNKLASVPTIEWNTPIEQAIEKNPDFIIFSSPAAVPAGQLEDFKTIAPTYVFKDEDFSDWRTQLTIVGEIVGKKEQAETLLQEYETLTSTRSKEIKDKIGDESVAAIWVVGGQYYLMESNRFAGNVLYSDLGLAQPTMIQNLGPAKDATWNPVTIEALAKLDADHIFLISTENEAGIKALENNAIWKGLPATKANHVYNILMDDSWTVNGLLASQKVIEDVVNTIQ